MILTVKDAPCDVFDANGQPLLYVVWCDTESGEAVHLIKEDGQFVLTIDEEGQQAVKKEWRQHPAPLTYVKR